MTTKIFFDEDINNEVKVASKTSINAKVVQAMKNLKGSYNDNANKIRLQKRKMPSKI